MMQAESAGNPLTGPMAQTIEFWPIDRLVLYARNPRKNDAAVDRMCGSIREFGFKIPVLARSNGEVVDGHLRIKAARKLGSWPGGDTTAIPVILCDEWTEQQVRAFRLLVNRSVGWAAWDEELLSLELQELNAADFDLELTGFKDRRPAGAPGRGESKRCPCRSRESGVTHGRSLALWKAPGALRGLHQGRGRGPAAGRPQADPIGDRPAIWN